MPLIYELTSVTFKQNKFSVHVLKGNISTGGHQHMALNVATNYYKCMAINVASNY